jgi:hypothetical protein
MFGNIKLLLQTSIVNMRHRCKLDVAHKHHNLSHLKFLLFRHYPSSCFIFKKVFEAGLRLRPKEKVYLWAQSTDLSLSQEMGTAPSIGPR